MSSIIERAAKSEGVKDLPAFATRKRCGRDLVQVCVGFTAKRLENLAQALARLRSPTMVALKGRRIRNARLIPHVAFVKSNVMSFQKRSVFILECHPRILSSSKDTMIIFRNPHFRNRVHLVLVLGIGL
jgi:tRNA pseudouridine-54 N-methylase